MDNQQWRAYHALRKVAQMEGITVQQVIRNIDDAIREAYSSAKDENNQEVLKRWKEVPCEGELPTALELVAYLGEKCYAE